MSSLYKSKLRSSKNIVVKNQILKPSKTKVSETKNIKPKSKSKPKTTFKDIMKLLKVDETFTKAHKKYKFDKVKENTFPMQDYNFMVDLILMPVTSKKLKYILVVVDLWSDEFDIEPMITNTSDETVKAFKKIIKRPYLNLPKGSIRSDNGSEFKKDFHKYLETNKIMHRQSKPYRHKQNGNVESLNRLITRILMTYLTNKEIKTGDPYYEWTDLISKIRTELNKYRKKPDGDPFNLDPILRNDMTPLYKVGDIVIPKLEYAHNAMGQKETSEGFRSGDIRWDRLNALAIVKVLNYPNNNRYILNTMPNVSFAEAELMKSDKTDEYHEVKQIIGHKIENRKHFYLVWWKSFKKKNSTWEPKTNLLEDGLKTTIKEFHDELDELHELAKGKSARKK